MIAQVYLTNNKYQKSLESFLAKFKIGFSFSSSLEQFRGDLLDTKPNIFILQVDSNNSLDALYLITDIRSIFGSIATIIVLGEVMLQQKVTTFLTEGADQFFSFPLDEDLMEDFLNKRTGSACYNAFKYRNIPSRSTEAKLSFDVDLVELNSRGAVFESEHLIKNGTVVEIDLAQVLSDIDLNIQILITHSIPIVNKNYQIYGVFFELSEEDKSQIIHQLRMQE